MPRSWRATFQEKSPAEVAPTTMRANNDQVSFRPIDAPIVSENIVHRVERVPDWRPSDQTPGWRSLCGTRVGATSRGGVFEFEVPVALDPESWRLAANCQACLAATRKRELGTLT
jgi:hypothetical protein